MTSFFGFYFVILVLAMIPLTLLGAGRDTTHKRAERKERQKEALLEWTDKDAVHEETKDTIPVISTRQTSKTPVEVIRITRENTGIQAA